MPEPIEALRLYFDNNDIFKDEYDYKRLIKAYDRRQECINKYSFAVPTEEALACIAKYAPIVEIGAGGGYWAHLLLQRGVQVDAYDKDPVESGRNHWKFTAHLSVREGGPEVLSHWTLFLCWPYMDAMAWQCLKEYQGQHVIYIGEGQGGCTANDEFFAKLEREYDEVEEIDIPQWRGIHDGLTVYRRNECLTPRAE